jgi:D-alanyl-lipoteichoic acid acyltransferase DltB (MBOAT superfamily)
MVTMLLGGLWHGASWRFMAWGGLHGAGLAVERAMGIGPDHDPRGWRRALHVLATFTVVTVAWAIFRADKVSTAALMLEQAFSLQPWALWTEVFKVQAISVGLIAAGFALHALPLTWLDAFRAHLGHWPPMFKAAALALLFLGVWQFQGSGAQPFIYFQF